MTTKTKKQVPLRLDVDLFDMAMEKAKAENRSFNNYVENLLFKDVGNVPNEETKKAIEEAMAGSNLEKITDIDALMDSVK
ncbi:hypothetical protein [Flagellimonas sp. C4]|uniref:hypothetical protein n=1 Tax=Flagellimonas alginolytica TaxID=3177515 RepID=UPI0035C92D13